MTAKLDIDPIRARPGIERLLAALGESQGDVKFVGGMVRDGLLGTLPDDMDFATRHRPEEVVRRLESAGIKAVPTGIAHGTVTAVSDGSVVEVTTLRADLDTDGRRATVAFSDNYRDDAARRDFTINALYADPLTGEIADYFGGLDDLEARRVAFIGDPLTRIAEDHLRILRFFRFTARFANGDADADGLAACTARANDLMALSRERIADELLKILALPDPSSTIQLMLDAGIFAPVLPEVTQDGVNRLKALIWTEREANLDRDALRRLAAFLPADEAIVRDVAARLKLSNVQRQRLASAAGKHDMGVKESVYRLGREKTLDRLALADDRAGLAQATIFDAPTLPIKGGELIERGVPKGPGVARALQRIEALWIAEDFPEGQAFAALVARVLSEPSSPA